MRGTFNSPDAMQGPFQAATSNDCVNTWHAPCSVVPEQSATAMGATEMSPTHLRFHLSMIASLAGMLAGPVAALAAPFCVRTEAIPPQCLYFDASECGKRATQMGGICVVNPAELHVSSTLGHYCLLTSSWRDVLHL